MGAFLCWRTCSLKGASTLFRWQWRFVSLSCQQYPHILIHTLCPFYMIFFTWLSCYICSLYLLCCVIDDREHAINSCKPYVNHSTLFSVPIQQYAKSLRPLSHCSAIVIVIFGMIDVFSSSNLQIMKKMLCLVHGKEVSWNI